MFQVKTPTSEFTLPSGWPEVTLSQYLNLFDKQVIDDDGQPSYQVADVLYVLASDAALLEQLTSADQELLLQQLTFMGQQPDFSQLTGSVEVNGVRLPTDFRNGTLLQKWTIEQVVRDSSNEGKSANFISIAVPVLTIYLYPILTGKPLTDASQVDEVLAQVEALPVTSALPLSAFFLDRLTTQLLRGATVGTLLPVTRSLPWPQRLRMNWNRFRYWWASGRKRTIYLKFS